MHIFKKTAMALALVAAVAAPAAFAEEHGKVLIVMSGAHTLELRDGKQYATGYYLDELAIPLRKLLDAGYTPVFASPNGEAPSVDAKSNDKLFFGGDDAKRAGALKLVQGEKDLKHPKALAAVLAEGTNDYVGIFIPGGHAPMQDLARDKDLGKILKSFHDTARPTGVICHGPTALLSTLGDPNAFRDAVAKGDYPTTAKLAAGWPYAGYHLTVFATGEERNLEGASGQLGGSVVYYAEDALAEAGAHVERVAAYHSNVVVDRELVSGEQPFSSDEFGDVFVAKLQGKSVH